MVAVLVDRLPAWILPPYGTTWVAMPALCGLAARGVVLERVVATGDDPRRTLADLLATDARGGGLAAAAAARGWRMALVTDDATLATAEAWGPGGGVAAAWAEATVRYVEAVAHGDVESDPERTNLARLFAAARELVAAGGHRLVVVHVTSLGVAWDAPEEFRNAYVDPADPPPPAGGDVPEFAVDGDTDPDLVVGVRQVFAGQLTLLDRCLDGLLAAVHEAPAAPSAGQMPAQRPAPSAAAHRGGWAVLVAGLRGFGLGLHGRVGGSDLPPYGELVHLPAVLVDAGGRMAAQRYDGLVTPADVGATAVEMLGGRAAAPEPAAPWGGTSLEPLFATWRPQPRDRIVTIGGAGVAITTPAWRLVAATTSSPGEDLPPRLFTLPDDFFEFCDVADRCPEVAAELGRLLEEANTGRTDRSWLAVLTAEAVRGIA